MIGIMVRKAISIFVVVEGVILLSYLYDFIFFINLQVAFLSSFFVIVGSSYAYKKMVENQVEAKKSQGEVEEDGKRELLDTIEDPYELYEDSKINDAPVEELDLKEIVKEEKAKIKTFSLQSAKYGARGSVSLFRLLPYLFLVLGFIALKNHNYLHISYYLPSILLGIIVASLVVKPKGHTS